MTAKNDITGAVLQSRAATEDYKNGWDRIFGGKAKTPENNAFCSVGKLRSLLDGLPDDQMVICQVVAKDGKAWNMFGSFIPRVRDSSFSLVQFDHPEIETLPSVEQVSKSVL